MICLTRSTRENFKRSIFALAVSPLLMGCPGDDDPAVYTKIVCARMKQYSLETQKRAAAELRAVRSEAPTVVMMFGDYLALRRSVAACIADQEAAAKVKRK